jgi:hypothetical protein
MTFKRPSTGTVIACIALFVALSGVGYAAQKLKKLPKNIVTAKSLKNGVVTEPKIKNGAVTALKLAPGVANTPAYARVTNSGATTPTLAVDPANSKNVTVAPTTGGGAGLVCIDASVPVKSISANTDATGPAAIAQVQVPAPNTCPAGADALVRTKTLAGADTNVNFYVTLFN